MATSRHRRLDKAWKLFDHGETLKALEAVAALRREEPDDPEAILLEAAVRQEVGELAEALALARRAVELAPDAPFSRLTLASVLYDLCDFEAGLAEVRRAREADPEDAFAHYLEGLLQDMLGHRELSEACFQEAERLDPEGFPPPLEMDEAAFRRALEEAQAALPTEFRIHVKDLPIVVEDLPSRALLKSLPDPSPDLLGLFVGVPLTRKSVQDLPGPPDAIYLFKRNLERACADPDDLVEEIGVTLLHEIGHYLGMEEGDLDEAGYA